VRRNRKAGHLTRINGFGLVENVIFMHVIIAVSAKAHEGVGAAQARTGARQLLEAAATAVAGSSAARCGIPVVRRVAVQPAVAIERDAARCDALLGVEVALLLLGTDTPPGSRGPPRSPRSPRL
jgi:hypothetical protein